MNPASMPTISAEQSKDMREQAAAWRRAREARGPVPARSASRFALITRNALIDRAEATAGPGSSLRTSNPRAALAANKRQCPHRLAGWVRGSGRPEKDR